MPASHGAFTVLRFTKFAIHFLLFITPQKVQQTVKLISTHFISLAVAWQGLIIRLRFKSAITCGHWSINRNPECLPFL